MSDKESIPAFPESYGDPRNPGWIGGGMTLRDYFAAKALQSMIHTIYSTGFTGKSGSPITEEIIAAQSYHFADAMLVERAK